MFTVSIIQFFFLAVHVENSWPLSRSLVNCQRNFLGIALKKGKTNRGDILLNPFFFSATRFLSIFDRNTWIIWRKSYHNLASRRFVGSADPLSESEIIGVNLKRKKRRIFRINIEWIRLNLLKIKINEMSFDFFFWEIHWFRKKFLVYSIFHLTFLIQTQISYHLIR